MRTRAKRGTVVPDESPAIVADVNGAAISLGPLPDFLGYALRRAQMTVFESFTRMLAQFQLKPGDFGVLIVIDHNPGLRSTDVCNALGFQKANFAPLLQRLEGRNLVKRVSSPSDRRAQSLQLTAAGRKLLARALQVHAEHEQDMLGNLDREAVSRLIVQLNKLANGLE
ncbi:MAG: MarR family winged helix-turn-helix transcriptional regulator [Steroidobacteraceae bacterium]